jgi:pimeloyl-ACP methyl ester carboxylesterase
VATIVLIHGSWHGGWCWQKLVPLLRHHGHDVYTPTLTGMGERSHLLGEQADIERHIRDILQFLFYEGLRDVIMVGHSYGGVIISGVAEQAADRIARLVYLDAFIPRDGDSLFSMRPPEFANYFRDRAEKEGDGTLLPALPPEEFGVRDPEDVAWMRPRLCPVRLETFADPVRVPTAAAERLARSYIFCTESGFGAEAERAKQEGWDYYELQTGHDPMVTMPHELSAVLLSCALGDEARSPNASHDELREQHKSRHDQPPRLA